MWAFETSLWDDNDLSIIYWLTYICQWIVTWASLAAPRTSVKTESAISRITKKPLFLHRKCLFEGLSLSSNKYQILHTRDLFKHDGGRRIYDGPWYVYRLQCLDGKIKSCSRKPLNPGKILKIWITFFITRFRTQLVNSRSLLSIHSWICWYALQMEARVWPWSTILAKLVQVPWCRLNKPSAVQGEIQIDQKKNSTNISKVRWGEFKNKEVGGIRLPATWIRLNWSCLRVLTQCRTCHLDIPYSTHSHTAPSQIATRRRRWFCISKYVIP